MMAADSNMVPVDGTHIPAWLREQPRWAPWEAEWNVKRRKFDKIPKRADLPESRLSTKTPEKWFSYEAASKAYQSAGGMLAGVGFVLTKIKDMVGIDLDGVIDDQGQMAPWAKEIVERIGSYTEVSPSGRGLRIFARGTIPLDWTNNEVGIEVYAGNKARFLTVTGKHVAGTPATLTRPDPAAFTWLDESFHEKTERPKVENDPGDMPLLLPEAETPAPGALDLPPHALGFLSGEPVADRSRALFATAVALGNAGLTPAAALSVLANNPVAWEVALSHRRDDADKAMLYLWEHHVRKALPLVTRATEDDFDVPDGEGLPRSTHPLAQFVDYSETPKPPEWILPAFIDSGVCIIAGGRAVGKTTVLLPLAAAVAGFHAEGYPLAPRHWRHVVYVAEDTDQACRIIVGLAGHLGVSVKAIKERLHIVGAHRMAPAELVKVGKFYRRHFTRTVEGLAGQVELPPLVVLDTIAASVAMESENDNAEASAAVAALKQKFAGLPVWMIGHVTKSNLSRADVDGITMRGAGAFESDAQQVVYAINEADTRWLVRGKTRFESPWKELQIESFTAEAAARDQFGEMEIVTMRWSIAMPPSADRKEVTAQTKAARQAEREAQRALTAAQGRADCLKRVHTYLWEERDSRPSRASLDSAATPRTAAAAPQLAGTKRDQRRAVLEELIASGAVIEHGGGRGRPGWLAAITPPPGSVSEGLCCDL